MISEENIAKVKQCLGDQTAKSIRQIALIVKIARESVRTILKNELKLFPYKVQFVNKIPENSIIKRLEFCKKTA